SWLSWRDALNRKRPAAGRAFFRQNKPLGRLLDLSFAELDVLAGDRIVLLQHELVGLGPGVLLGHVEVAGVRRGVQADLDGGGLRHGRPWAGPGGQAAGGCSKERRNIRIRGPKSMPRRDAR